jgi:hypothetical protein
MSLLAVVIVCMLSKLYVRAFVGPNFYLENGLVLALSFDETHI